MKKQQKTFNWDQNDLESSDELDGGVLDGLEGLDDFDDEEIIDLSEGDIIDDDSEGSIMDDFGSGDLMEPDVDLGLGELGSGGGKSRPHSLTDGDLMDEMAIVDEDLALGEDESLEVRVLEEEDVAEAEVEAEAEEEMDFSDLMGLLDDAPGDQAAEEDGGEPEVEEPAAEGEYFNAAPAEADAAGDDPVEDLIARIESRLEDVVRRIVDARLPEIVREALREEIERLKQ